MCLVTSGKGHQLLTFDRCDSPVPDEHIPMPLALVVARHRGKVLFIYNSWRKEWELPGGMIDEGETPEAAAKRELTEETAQIATELTFVALAKMRLKPDNRLEFGAIYTCDLHTLQPFRENEEASRIMWWDVSTPLDEPFSEIDAKIAELTLRP